MTRSLAVLLLAAIAPSCRCQHGDDAPALSVTPEMLVIPSAWLSQTTSGSVKVSNAGATTEVPVSVDAPFAVSVTALRVERGQVVELDVSFTPPAVGRAAGVLRIGALEVPVESEGLEVPACQDTLCRTGRFDFSLGQCAGEARPNGTACETRCTKGQCVDGDCRGPSTCDDGNLCTVDLCNETAGCTHSPRSCTAASRACEAVWCDPAAGCVSDDAIDGTLCGPNVCPSSVVDFCTAGQCSRRNDPDRCQSRWALMNIWPISNPAMAWDFERERVLLFGGSGTTSAVKTGTWEYDGTAWSRRTEVRSPPERILHAMASDPIRKRIVLFGGGFMSSGGTSDETWEWDGATWTQKQPATSPYRRQRHAMAWDGVRQRVVLFGGNALRLSDETWEWDGTTWTQRMPPTSPSARENHAMAWDGARQRVVLFGGFGYGPTGLLNDTWEWDGTTWVERQPAVTPPARERHALAWDAAHQRVVLFGGFNTQVPNGALNDTWEWDGTAWVQRQPPWSPPQLANHAMAWDERHRRVVLYAAQSALGTFPNTWEWDGTSWAQKPPTELPSPRVGHAIAWDTVRQRLVLFGGLGALAAGLLSDTWEWDGVTWIPMGAGTAPSARSGHAMAWDGQNQRVILFGGGPGVQQSNETWAWDGVGWSQQRPAASPPARTGAAMVWDSAHRSVVLFGGRDGVSGFNPLSDTWEWDGATWVKRQPATSPPARALHALAIDGARGRVVLFGGKGASGPLADTWEWDGATWTQRRPATSPPPRSQHGMTWNAARQRVVLHGGIDANGGLADTWEWDGTSWTQPPLTSPGSEFPAPALAWDPARQRVINFDGTTTWLLP